MPDNGMLVDLALWRYDEFTGSDSDYWDARFKVLSFHQLHEKFVLGLRLEGLAIDGNAPFFAIPWVTLRGIPAMRYQGARYKVFEAQNVWIGIDIARGPGETNWYIQVGHSW